MIKKRIAEYRALPTKPTNEKGLTEKRIELMVEMEGIVHKTKAETRALNDEEEKRFNEIKTEVEAIDRTLAAVEEQRALQDKTPAKKEPEKEQRALDEEKFLRFIKGEERALDVANNGGIIPTTIANKIIEKVKELSPIYQMATVYNVGGDLVFPVYDETTPIQATYVEDLTELTEQTGKFTTVKLQNFIIGVLAKVSKSLMNRSDFDLVGFVVNKVAQAMAEMLEKECLVGTSGKMTGVLSATQGITAASSTTITADELIDLQDSIPDVYQANACWIMNKTTRKAIRKLKDNDGNYLLNKDITTPFGYSLLGKQVYISENCPEMAAGNKSIVYGDMSGLYVKLTQNVEIQVLIEKYATQHAVGVVGYVEADSKIVEPQKLAVLTMKSA
ncbi:phage major capsid protein [Clostridium tetani]|uniref:phage major capsid protein n=1 Tax=Clostridium tetani TaxID=1513 RepID=UPI00100BC8BF|nr:phage major capsid protein [Clostridium tetani]RXI50189.1 phage major capsid protein [Clostridium tetani]